MIWVLIIYACGVVLFTGMYFAYWQRNWPRFGMPKEGFYSNRSFSLAYGLFPIIGWFVVLLTSDFGRHGWLWPWSDKAYKEAGIK